MTPEKPDPSLREIKFQGEGMAESINRGYAIATLRIPKPDYFVTRGERILADCTDDGEKVPVMIITNVIERLDFFSIPQLALDGFFSVPMAIRGMRSYPGYENIHRGTAMQAITFVKEDSCKKIPRSLKEELRYRHFDELVRMPELRALFLPTMCFHFSNHGGAIDWIDFLGFNKLISVEEKLEIKNYEYQGRNIAQFLQDNPGIFQKLALDPSIPLFRPMILGLFDQT